MKCTCREIYPQYFILLSCYISQYPSTCSRKTYGMRERRGGLQVHLSLPAVWPCPWMLSSESKEKIESWVEVCWYTFQKGRGGPQCPKSGVLPFRGRCDQVVEEKKMALSHPVSQLAKAGESLNLRKQKICPDHRKIHKDPGTKKMNEYCCDCERE